MPEACAIDPNRSATARDDSANATPAWLTAPDAAPPLVAVDLSSFVDAALEAEVWALDARLARAEAAA